MKHVFKCTWGSIELTTSGMNWNLSVYGDCPRDIKKNIDKLEKKAPRPDAIMAHFFIKHACGKTLLYTT